MLLLSSIASLILETTLLSTLTASHCKPTSYYEFALVTVAYIIKILNILKIPNKNKFTTTSFLLLINSGKATMTGFSKRKVSVNPCLQTIDFINRKIELESPVTRLLYFKTEVNHASEANVDVRKN